MANKFAIPSVDEWVRSEFLEARKRQLQSPPKVPPGFEGADVIVMDAGDDVICDTCNAEINDPTVLLVEYGRRVACSACYRKNYFDQPLRYRYLNEDGSLGDEREI